MRMLSIWAIAVILFHQKIGISASATVCNNRVLSNEFNTGGVCYSISVDRASWHVAKATCAMNGGRLARILNGDMSDEIERIIKEEGVTEDYWIGLERVGNTEQFQWTDGTNPTYNQWSNGNPMQGYSCVGVNGNSNSWVSIDCNDNNYYICEIGVCENWKVRNGICYKRFHEDNTWSEAELLCERENGYLAEIPNIYVNNIISDEIVEGHRCWIGLTSNNSGYYWRSGGFPLSDPDTNSPLNLPDGDMCGLIGDDRWDLFYCDITRECTVCMKGPLISEAPTEVCTGATTSTIIDRDNCYRKIKEIHWNLDIAFLTCNSYNGVLYTLKDARVNMKLYSNYSMEIIHDPKNYELFDPQEGYFNLMTSIDYSNDFGCVRIQENGNLENANCDQLTLVSYICKSDLVPTAPVNLIEDRTINCSAADSEFVCTALESVLQPQDGNLHGGSLLFQREEILKDFLMKVNILTGVTQLVFNSQDIFVIITAVRADTNTNIPVGKNSIQVAAGSFSAETSLIILADLDPSITTEILLSDFITIIASNELMGELTIAFQIANETKYKKNSKKKLIENTSKVKISSKILYHKLLGNPENGEIQCVSLILNAKEEWSSEGISTGISLNGSEECTTTHLTTFAVLFSSSRPCDKKSSGIGKLILVITSYTLLAISVLFLLTSVVTFLFSGKKFFSIDINIIHFNHTLSLLLAVSCFILLIKSASKVHWLCTSVAFFLHLLWTNVFLSSLSIAILVFYSIWVVSIKHTARKLSIFLIPICWGVSIIWALVWIGYGKATNRYLDLDTHNETTRNNCHHSCFLSTESHLILSFLIPIYVILLSNATILCICLYRIRKVLRVKNTFESELSRLRRVAIGAILLIPALNVPFIIAIPLSFSSLMDDTVVAVFEWAFILSNAPIGVVHFLLITLKIPEANPRNWCRSKHHELNNTSVMESSISRDTLNRKSPIRFHIVRPNSYNNVDTPVD